jgi:hypothetical protein
VHRSRPVIGKAGLLAYGSLYSPHLPVRHVCRAVAVTDFVPDYSGGTTPDLHGIPNYAPVLVVPESPPSMSDGLPVREMSSTVRHLAFSFLRQFSGIVKPEIEKKTIHEKWTCDLTFQAGLIIT